MPTIEKMIHPLGCNNRSRRSGGARKQRNILFAASCLLLVLMLLSLWDGDGMSDVAVQRRMLEKLLPADKSMKIVGFWHIGGNAQPTQISRDEFVHNQAEEILDSYLFKNDLNVQINYVTRLNLSNETKDFLAESGYIHELPPTAIPSMKEDEEYFEYPTLQELHKFCTSPDNLDTVVFYIHSKTNDEWRKKMEEYLFGQECVRCLSDESNTACGFNFKKDFLWQHFAGNFWMTRCSHVKTLNEPFSEYFLDEARNNPSNGGTGFAWSFPPYGRSFAEFWLSNDSGERPEHAWREKKGLLNLDEICSNNL